MSTKQYVMSGLANTHECGDALGFASSTIRMSRVTGVLAGVPAPTYRKIGRKVVYDRVILDQWLEQFANQSNTAGSGVAL
jgi:hypothetical protein